MHGLEHDTGCQFTWRFFFVFSIRLCSPLQRSFIRSSVYSLRMRPARPVLNVLSFYFVLLNSREFLAIAVGVRLASLPRVHSLQHSIQYFFSILCSGFFRVCIHRLSSWPYTMYKYICKCMHVSEFAAIRWLIYLITSIAAAPNKIKSLSTFKPRWSEASVLLLDSVELQKNEHI